MDHRALLGSIAEAVREGSIENASSLCIRALEQGISPGEIIEDGLSRGMQDVGRLYQSGEFFLPELLVAAEAMGAGVSVLLSAIGSGSDIPEKSTVVIGMVEGDVHEIGKNLVKVMLQADGYRVIDLGYDVPARRFLEEVGKTDARALALSTMMTTTLPNMRKTVELAHEISPRPVVIVGGAPLSAGLASDMGADGFGENAAQAPGLLRSLLT